MLMLFGTVALVALGGLSFLGPSPADGITRLTLGAVLVAFNRVVAESGALVVLGLAGSPSTGEVHPEVQPQWYSPGRVAVCVLGLSFVVSALVVLTGGVDLFDGIPTPI